MNIRPTLGPDVKEVMQNLGIDDMWSLARLCGWEPEEIWDCINDPSFSIFVRLEDEQVERWTHLRSLLRLGKSD